MRFRFPSLLPALGLALILAGCIGKQIRPLSGDRPSYPYRFTGSRSSRWLLADSLWDLRSDPKAARRSLEEYRREAVHRDNVPEVLARLSHACYFVATYFESSAVKRDALFREGQDAAEKAMMQHPGFKKSMQETGDETEAAKELDASFVEPLYWYVVNLGRELNQESVIVRRGNKDRMEALDNRLLELDPAFYYAGPHRIAGVIPTRLPEGDLKASKAHFEKAVAMAPLYLANRVAYAEFYALQAKDKQTFVKQLTLAAAVPADTLPEIAPENRLAREKAKALLAKADSLFP